LLSRSRASFAAISLLLSSAAFAQPLPTDPRIVSGTLDNGMSYMVMRHAFPPGRAAFYINVSSGSLNETDKQRGIAHYLEHMAFNGSDHFPPGSVIDFFQSMGLTFGRHQNAFTSFEQTTFILEMPDNKPETIEKGFRFFSDVAFHLTLLPKEIDEERQVIMEEKRTRLGAAQRIQEYMFERIAPGSRFGQRIPIGTEATIMSVQQPDFKDYYTTWYTPSNMTLMVVADLDPATVVPMINAQFSGGDRKPRPVDLDPGVKPYEKDRAIIATDPELKRASVSIMKIDKALPPTLTEQDFRRDLIENLAVAAYNRRLDAKQSEGKLSGLSNGASVGQLSGTIRMITASSGGEADKWRQMLTETAAELQRSIIHGLSARDIEESKKELLAGTEQFAKTEPTMSAAAMLGRMNSAVASGEPVMSAEQSLELTKKLVPGITPEEVNKAFRDAFDPKAVAFTLQLPSGTPDTPTEEQLVEFGRKALTVTPEADSEAAAATQLLSKLPDPGTVKQSQEHAATGVTTAMLSNNVRVNHRFMDYKKNEASLLITLAAGEIQETATDRGITDAASIAWGKPATSTLSSTNIRDLMSDKKVQVGGGGGGDAYQLSVSGDPADFETGMQLAYLLLTDPKIEQAEFDQWKARTMQGIDQRKASPQGMVQEVIARTIWPKDDVRNQPLEKPQVEKITREAAQARLEKVIREAPIEVTVVGDMPKERAMELVTRYLGSLPPRTAITSSTLDDLRKVERPKGPLVTHQEMETTTPLALGMGGFYASDAENVDDTRRLNLASQVVSTRMIKSIREEKQLVYSIRASLRPGEEYPGFGLFFAGAPTEPGKAEKLGEALRAEYDRFAAEGPTEEELTVARKQIANTLDEQMKEPSWWLQRLDALAYRGMKLDDIMGGPDAYQKITAEEIKATFNKYYKPDTYIEIVMKPKASEPANKPEDATKSSAPGK
jgi:zinc protease